MARSGRRDILTSYASVECPDGDIALTLCKDGRCTLSKTGWDAERMMPTHTQSFEGAWSIDAGSKALALTFPEATLRYARDETEWKVAARSITLRGWRPESIPDGFPIDAVPLLEQERLDEFFMSNMPPVLHARPKKRPWWKFW